MSSSSDEADEAVLGSEPAALEDEETAEDDGVTRSDSDASDLSDDQDAVDSSGSEDTTKVDSDAQLDIDSSILSADDKRFESQSLLREPDAATTRDILLFLIAFRILNALSVRTFFQPDEHFQSLEPAWQIAFGPHSGAWITWEWKHHLRSTIHPFLFAAVYKLSATAADLLRLSPTWRADVLVAAPKVLQAFIAATGDYYTWKVGQKVYGQASNEAWAALALTVCNPWQWFVSTRTMSNCLETTLTTVALYLWPWQWSLAAPVEDGGDTDEFGSHSNADSDDTYQLGSLRQCLLLAAVACVLRPTNVLIWACLACFALLRITTCDRLLSFGWTKLLLWIRVSSISLYRANKTERTILIRETAICGSTVLGISALLDRAYYGQWTFPPFRFLYFNIAQSLAVFYGRNDWHYYLSQGYPLLLTTLLPFAITDLYLAIFPSSTPAHRLPTRLALLIRYQLAAVALTVPFILSFIAHKEVRFIYPLLPPLHTLAASSFTTFFLPSISPASPTRHTSASILKRFLLAALLIANILIATFTTQYHQRAPLSVLAYLRHEHEAHYLTQPPDISHIALADTTMTVGFLMPCHSTPWRSHLVHPGIKAWALGCEPPVRQNASARAVYRDEADQFYDAPAAFVRRTLGPWPMRKGLFGAKAPQLGLGLGRGVRCAEATFDGKAGPKCWPDYLVFFGALEASLLGMAGRESGYGECWRGWNSFVHDDWRRKGDIVVWCLRGKEGR
ncbi:hypothetical protein MMC19_000767 [Ptychographa xylographoides]|nr:hypothetical protein [Ptychographa xylographoides]